MSRCIALLRAVNVGGRRVGMGALRAEFEATTGWRVHGRAARSGRRVVVSLLCVIAIHLLLYGWLRSSGGWRMQRDTRVAPPVVTLRLLPWPEAAPRQPARDAKAAAPPRSGLGPVGVPSPARADPAPAATPAIAQPDASAAPHPPASQPAPPSQPPALNLALPPASTRGPTPRNPAVDDPRANTARRTPEQRMATTFDTRVTEEDLGDGRRRLRQGDACVIVKPSRIGQLMPFDEAAARSPSLVGACP